MLLGDNILFSRVTLDVPYDTLGDQFDTVILMIAVLGIDSPPTFGEC